MVRILLLVSIMLISCGTACKAETPEPPPAPGKIQEEDPEPIPATIREVVAEAFPEGNVFIGCASHYDLVGTEAVEILDREFNYVTPANDFKQSYIHPSPGKWNWEKSDKWVQRTSQNNQVIRLHSPISPQVSQWARDDSRTVAELETNLEEYMTALCKRYNGTPNILWIDVVNETIDCDGNWFGPKPGSTSWENPWPILGFDESSPLRPPVYIEKAFRIANEYAPDMKQIINEHCFGKDVWEKMKKLVVYLRDKGIRVDGLGWQAHVNVGWEKTDGNLEYLGEVVDWCHQNNLEFHITEFNVWLRDGDENKLEEQADTFTSISKVVLDRKDQGIVGINFWHIAAKNTNQPSRDGCLFGNDYLPKPAYEAVKKLLFSYKKK